MYDVIIIGSGPNGLAAGIVLAREGLAVKIFEAKDTIGGGMRTKELTLPGFKHDVCSTIYPVTVGSPFLKTLPLEDFALEWIYPEYPLAHPMDNEPAAVMYKSIDKTAAGLGEDGEAYKKLVASFTEHWDELSSQLFRPLLNIPSTPLLMAQFGLKAIPSATFIANRFKTKRAKALFAGLAGHSILPLDTLATSSFGLMLAVAGHVVNWPMAKGGGQQIAEAMACYFKSMGGDIETNHKVLSTNDLPDTSVLLFDTSPKQVLNIAGDALPGSYTRKLRRFKHGPGVFKMDIALDGPIPWKDERCIKAGTIHLGGTFEEIARSEKMMSRGRHSPTPFVLLAQQSMFDSTRAPEGKHTVWAYCHVPNGSTVDMSEPILNQIERFAPGFRQRILKTHTMNTRQMQAYNPNYIGGDIIGGKQSLSQMIQRPAGLFDPYHIPNTDMFICSSSTPPGGGVHGMCGYHAAQSALRHFNLLNP